MKTNNDDLKYGKLLGAIFMLSLYLVSIIISGMNSKEDIKAFDSAISNMKLERLE